MSYCGLNSKKNSGKNNRALSLTLPIGIRVLMGKKTNTFMENVIFYWKSKIATVRYSKISILLFFHWVFYSASPCCFEKLIFWKDSMLPEIHSDNDVNARFVRETLINWRCEDFIPYVSTLYFHYFMHFPFFSPCFIIVMLLKSSVYKLVRVFSYTWPFER